MSKDIINENAKSSDKEKSGVVKYKVVVKKYSGVIDNKFKILKEGQIVEFKNADHLVKANILVKV